MDNIENPTPAQPESNESSELSAQLQSLHHLVTSLIVLLLVVSGTLSIFLYRQWKFTKNELDAIRPTASQVIGSYQRGAGQAMDEFVKRIADYSRTHPDFAPIAAKYRLNEISAAPGKPGAAPALPVGAPSSKK
jgi:hypothetical protein